MRFLCVAAFLCVLPELVAGGVPFSVDAELVLTPELAAHLRERGLHGLAIVWLGEIGERFVTEFGNSRAGHPLYYDVPRDCKLHAAQFPALPDEVML